MSQNSCHSLTDSGGFTVADLSLCVVQSLLQLPGQDAALADLLLQLLLNAVDVCLLRDECLGHLAVFYPEVVQLPTQTEKKKTGNVYTPFTSYQGICNIFNKKLLCLILVTCSSILFF